MSSAHFILISRVFPRFKPSHKIYADTDHTGQTHERIKKTKKDLKRKGKKARPGASRSQLQVSL